MERKRKRKEDRHQRWIQEKEEAEQRERDEALRKRKSLHFSLCDYKNLLKMSLIINFL